MNLKDLHTIYFLGIGGIGMSAIARYFRHQGKEVYGYDKTATALTKQLEAEGCHIHYTDDPSLLPENIDLVVLTPAIPPDHQEWHHLREKGLPVYKRSQVLGMISRGHKTIGIAGTHGKTSTTTLVTWLLRHGGVDCSAFLGGIALNFSTNYLAGSSDWIVMEADEYDRSFLQLDPDIAVINSVEADHLDIYGNADAVLESYRAYASKIKPTGWLLLKTGQALSWSTEEALQLSDKGVKIQVFGLEDATFYSDNIRAEGGYMVFDYHSPSKTIKNLQFTQPGLHNIENATAAITIALQLGVEEQGIRSGLLEFRGVKRRFEYHVRTDEQVYIDDYAHHPTELSVTIQAARMLYPNDKITGIFQPHLYSRTRDFSKEFAEALDLLDQVILLDIYPAREQPIPGVTSQMVAALMQHSNVQILSKTNALEWVSQHAPKVLLTMGAGDIDTLVEPLKGILKNG